MTLTYTAFALSSIDSLPHNLKRKTSENIVGKGENAGNQHFLLFPYFFLRIPLQTSFFESHLFCRLQDLVLSSGTSPTFHGLVKS